MVAYFGVIHKDEYSDYGISFPDFPGCVSAGSSFDELDIMAREALRLHIEGMLEDKESLPTPCEYADMYARYAREEGFVGIILVTATPHNKYIDTRAQQYALDRPGVMVCAARQVRYSHVHPRTAQA